MEVSTAVSPLVVTQIYRSHLLMRASMDPEKLAALYHPPAVALVADDEAKATSTASQLLVAKRLDPSGQKANYASSS